MVAKKFESKVSIKLRLTDDILLSAEGPKYVMDELKTKIFVQINDLTQATYKFI